MQPGKVYVMRMILVRILVSLVALALPVTGDGADDRTDVSWLYDYSASYRTPCFEWAKPGDYMLVRALVAGGGREWAELMQRMHLEADVANLVSSGFWPARPNGGDAHTRGATPREAIGRLRAFLEKAPPVIAFFDGKYAFLEEEGQVGLLDDILERVRSGKANLIIGSDEKKSKVGAELWAVPEIEGEGALLTRALPIPEGRELECSVARLGKGKVYRISHPRFYRTSQAGGPSGMTSMWAGDVCCAWCRKRANRQ